MTLTGEAGIGVRAADGNLMWRQRNVANRTANITTPVSYDNKVADNQIAARTIVPFRR
jgi:hypothetical protein